MSRTAFGYSVLHTLTVAHRHPEWIGKVVGGLSLTLKSVRAMTDFDELTVADLEEQQRLALYAPCLNCQSGLRQLGADVTRFSPKRLLS